VYGLDFVDDGPSFSGLMRCQSISAKPVGIEGIGLFHDGIEQVDRHRLGAGQMGPDKGTFAYSPGVKKMGTV
jgi:hypothetical protein